MENQQQVRGEKLERWRLVLDEQAVSGISVARFCRARGLSKHTFGYWKAKLKDSRSTQLSPVFQEVRLAPERTSAPGCFEIVVGALVVRVPAGFDEADLRRVLATVAAVC